MLSTAASLFVGSQLGGLPSSHPPVPASLHLGTCPYANIELGTEEAAKALGIEENTILER